MATTPAACTPGADEQPLANEQKLSVLIPCKDEEQNILACINCARKVADEILVADSGSTDATLGLVRQRGGCRVIERPWNGFAAFKNWAIPQAAHPWVLVVDADERVTDALAAEIREVLRSDPPCDAYGIRHSHFFLGFPIRHCGWNNSASIRLFRRDVCRYDDRRVHENVVAAPERLGQLDHRFLHYTCRSLSRYLHKVNFYTTLAAEDMHAAGRRASIVGVALRPPLRFFKDYVVKRGFLDGAGGLLVCAVSTITTFLKYAKLWELNHRRSSSSNEAGGDACPAHEQPKAA